ncbi:MAG: hypothetical protein WD872_18900 [Pirellulaceae bacterium]
MTAVPKEAAAAHDAIQQWLGHLNELIGEFDGWAKELGWSTRRIEKSMKDADAGSYQASALMLQRDTTRVLLEPIARSAPGAEGVVDLYLMPAYDDIASLYLTPAGWQLHYLFPESPMVATIRDASSKTLSKEVLAEVLNQMSSHVA